MLSVALLQKLTVRLHMPSLSQIQRTCCKQQNKTKNKKKRERNGQSAEWQVTVLGIQFEGLLWIGSHEHGGIKRNDREDRLAGEKKVALSVTRGW